MIIEYTLTPTDQVFHMKGTASRILSSNLINNKKIDVKFSPLCLNIDYKFLKYMKKNFYSIRNTMPFNLMISVHPWLVFVSKYILTEEYKKTVKELLKEEYVMLTISHLLDLITIKYLLEDKRKVIIGGSTVTLFGPQYIRNMLKLMGATNLHNLLVIKGYVDLNTDLYPIIKKWEDSEISTINPKTFWDCREDFIQKFNHLSKKIYDRNNEFCNRFSYVTSILTLECWWGQCMYCSYKDLPIFDFRDEADKVSNSLIDILNRYEEKSLRFTDSYFEFDELNKKILDNLKDYEIRIVGGIHRMSKPEYVKDFNKYSQMISLGLECMDNDCLKRIKKGTNEKMIDKMVENLINYVDRDKDIVFCMISDLPFKNQDHIKYNYNRAIEMKRKLEDNGFRRVYFNFSLLQIDRTNYKRMFSLEPYISAPSTKISGRYQFFNYLTDHDKTYMKEIFMPFSRYDDKGKLMPSDYEIIGKEIEYLFNTKEEIDERKN